MYREQAEKLLIQAINGAAKINARLEVAQGRGDDEAAEELLKKLENLEKTIQRLNQKATELTYSASGVPVTFQRDKL